MLLLLANAEREAEKRVFLGCNCTVLEPFAHSGSAGSGREERRICPNKGIGIFWCGASIDLRPVPDARLRACMLHRRLSPTLRPSKIVCSYISTSVSNAEALTHKPHSVYARLARPHRPRFRSAMSSDSVPTFDIPHSSHSSPPKTKICVLGAGNFGSCLADHLGDSDHEVLLWSRSEAQIKYFNQYHRNKDYLKDHVFPDTISAIGPELPSAELLASLDVLLFSIPTEGVRKTLKELHPRLDPNNMPLLIFVNKGIETSTRALTLEIIADTCGPEVAKAATFLSGPSFAKEIVRRQPTSVSIASLSHLHAERASHVFHQPWFRCYIGTDPIGLELAGALKNVYAIATGIADGLGFENNTRAMLITRGLAEMTRIGVAYGANPLTFLSLAGVGDLFLTCSSPTSRNYTVGYRLGKGEKLSEIIRTLGSVAEGVSTTKGLKMVIDELGANAPIACGIYEVLYENKDVRERAQWLMSYPAMMELELPARSKGGPACELLKKLGMDENAEIKTT